MPSFADARADAPSSIDLSAVYRVIERFGENHDEVVHQPGKQVEGVQVYQQLPAKTLQRPFHPIAPVVTSRFSYHSDTPSLDDPGLATSDCSTPAHSIRSPTTPHFSRANSGYFSSAAAALRQEIVKRENAARVSANNSISDDGIRSRPDSGSSTFDLSSLSSPPSNRSTVYDQVTPQLPAKALALPSPRQSEDVVAVEPGCAMVDPTLQNRPSRHRSSSLSRLQFEFPETVSAKRRSSLPDMTQHQINLERGIFQEAEPLKDVVLRPGPPAVEPKRVSSSTLDDRIEAAQTIATVEKPETPYITADASVASAETPRPNVFKRVAASIEKTYYPSESPPLIMPTGPTDTEKLMYLHTNRLGLYTFGVFSFLSLSAGMWLFVVTNPIFYWFGAIVALLQVYLVISYGVSVMGKDYDYKEHLQILKDHPIDAATCPTVDIYLPCCKEPIEILENTYKHVQELKWPEEKLKVYVLDDGASDAVHALATQYGFEYICREDRPRLKKAGNLRWAFARTSGDFFTIYDADFCPRPDFLEEVIPVHLAKPDTAIVQTPQFFRTMSEQSWVEQGAGAVQELFYRVVQINRNRWGASICVGSNAVYRREALVDVGGTAEIGFSEDVHTGFYAVTRGWQVRYLPLCLACGICPDTPRAFFSQQMRWCMGSTTLLTNMDFWRSSLGFTQKICYLSGMMYYTAISLSIFVSPLPGVMMIWCRPEYVRFYNLAFAIPSIFYSLVAIRAWSKASFGFNAQFVMVIQSYAYLTAIKDRLFGRALAWVPSGDTKAHKNNKYRNMRILACCWMTTIAGLVASGCTYQVMRGMPWYDCFPLMLLDAFNLFLAHRFLLWSGKI